MLKTVLSPISLVFIALSMAAPPGNAVFTLAQTNASETTLALCETPSQSIRIYRLEGELLMRAYDRQNGIVWMNRTPVSPETFPTGTRYTNQFGEQTVTLLVSASGSDCTVQLGDNAPEPGTLLEHDPATADHPLDQVRQLYPDQVAQLEAECQTPASLDVRSFQNEGQTPRASFICWSAPDSEGKRTGQWLGTLPLTEDDPTFITPFTCPAGDQACESQLTALQLRYPETLEAAELTCSIKRGSLFFAAAGETTDIRCGFFATTLWDTNGDGNPEYEDPISVDVSLGQVPL